MALIWCGDTPKGLVDHLNRAAGVCTARCRRQPTHATRTRNHELRLRPNAGLERLRGVETLHVGIAGQASERRRECWSGSNVRDDPAKAGKSAHVNSDPSDTDRNHSDTEHDADGNGKVAQCEAHRPNAAISSTDLGCEAGPAQTAALWQGCGRKRWHSVRRKAYRPEQGHVSGDYDPPVKRHRMDNPNSLIQKESPLRCVQRVA